MRTAPGEAGDGREPEPRRGVGRGLPVEAGVLVVEEVVGAQLVTC
jgi:hypothetical protein